MARTQVVGPDILALERRRRAVVLDLGIGRGFGLGCSSYEGA
jgi:hypothetical protein